MMDEAQLAKFLEKLRGREEYVSDNYDRQTMYEDIAKSSENLEPSDIAAFAGIESQFGKYTKPLQGGSARGEFQMMPNTIKYLSERAESKGNSREANPFREEARLMAELIPQHESELKKTLGKDADISVSDIYVKHNLGAGDGKKLLRAKGNTPVEEILSEKVIVGNPGIYEGKSKNEVLKEIQKRLSQKKAEFKFEKRGPLDFLEE